MPRTLPKKSLGQNFLINPLLAQKMAGLLNAGPDNSILEIGPGHGALTKYLLAAPHKDILLLEKDRLLAGERRDDAAKQARIINMDAMAFAWERLAAKDRWLLIGNLPYNIASPLIWDIVSRCRGYEKAAFMVQKEVAQRLTATPGSGIYGALSVWVQCHARPRLEFCLKPGSFFPPPKVDSAVVSFIPLPNPPQHQDRLKQVLDLCFQNRRKQLGGIFKKAGLEYLGDALRQAGRPESLRPENLDCGDYLRLARLLSQYS